jgi:hypothetical protein
MGPFSLMKLGNQDEEGKAIGPKRIVMAWNSTAVCFAPHRKKHQIWI